MGRLTKSMNAMTASPGRSICGSRAGVTSRPSKKKIVISAISVSVSKKWAISTLQGISLAPSTIPAR